jgi:hypothetical protein
MKKRTALLPKGDPPRTGSPVPHRDGNRARRGLDSPRAPRTPRSKSLREFLRSFLFKKMASARKRGKQRIIELVFWQSVGWLSAGLG